MAELDNAFRVEDISIKDQFLITGGDIIPTTGLEAPIGSFYLTSIGSAYIKTGVLDSAWTAFNLFDERVKVTALDSTPGYLFDKMSSDHFAVIDNGPTLKINLAASGVTPGAYTKITADIYGRIITGSNPTTLGEYGITDAQPLNSNLTSIANNLTPGFLTLTAAGSIVSRLLTTTTLTITNDAGTTANPVINLSTTPVIAGSYANFTVDEYGRLTTARNLNSTDITTALGYTPLNKAGDTMTGSLYLNADPVNPLEAATKQYVDALTASHLDFKDSVRVATTTNIALHAFDDPIIDGVTIVVGDRILVKNQTNPAQNGLWEVRNNNWQRTADANGTPYVSSGLFCYVEEGTVHGGTAWVLSTNDPITIDTTPLTFVQFAGATTLSAGDGLIQTGSSFNVVTANSARIVVAPDAIDLATVGTAGSYNNVTTDAYGRVTAGSMVTYLTSNQTITLTGDTTGSGTTSIATTLVNIGTAGTYTKVTTDAKGRVTAGTTLVAADIPNLDWTKITTGKPTTLAGYGITNAVQNAGNTPSIQANTNANRPAAGTTGRLYYSTDLNALYRDTGTTWALIQPAITGDITISAGTQTATLANSGVTAGAGYNTFTVNAKGLVTAASTTSYLTANQSITISGDVSGTGTTAINLTLATVNAAPGSYGSATQVGQFTVNSKGLVTAASNVSIAFPVTSVAGRTGDIVLTSTDVGLNNVANSLQVINAGSTPSIAAGILASRPTAGTAGRIYVATDTLATYRDNGVAWDLLQPALSGDVSLNAGTTNTMTLTSVGTAGTYTKVTTDTKGRVISGTSINATDVITALGYTPVNKAGDTMSGLLILSADPVDPLGAATKQYVDNIVTGLDFKNSVRAATSANITLSGTQTVGGVALAVGNRVLVKNQTTASQNGIYVVASGTWARAADADSNAEVTNGMYCFIEEGTYAGQGWILSTVNPITLGTTALTFTQFNSGGGSSFTVNGGLTYSAGVLAVATASTSRIVVNPSNIDLATTGVTGGTYNNVTVDTYGRVTAGSNTAYLTSVTLTGDVTGSGTSSITTTLANSGVIAGSGYNNFTVNAKGLVTAASTVAYLTGNQTITISGDATGSGTTSIPLTLNTVPISKGGTGATTASAAFANLSPTTTKGDLIVDNDTIPVRLPVGADGNVLIADSTQAVGIKWSPATVPGSGRILQVKFAPIAAASGTTAMSTTNSAPLITEGSQLWSQSITTQSATQSTVRISTSMMLTGSSNGIEVGIAVFRDNTCIGAISQTMANQGSGIATQFTFYDSPGAIGTYTYTCRIGRTTSSGTWYVNQLSIPRWAGLMAKNAYTVEEIYTG